MRVLIIGGTSFTGPFVVRELLARGHTVCVFSRGNKPAPSGAEALQGDRRELDRHAPALRAFRPDIVIDAIAYTQRDAEELVACFNGFAARLFVLSSEDVYRAYDRLRRTQPGVADPAPLTEDSPLRERLFPYRAGAKSNDDSAYHYEKILVERVAQSAAGLPATILRLPAIYGPGDAQRRLQAYVRRMDDRRPAILLDSGFAAWRWSRGYVENVAHAIVLALEAQATGRIYNVGDEPVLSELQWVECLAGITGWTGRVIAVPTEKLPDPLRQPLDFSQDWAVSTVRIRQELAYREPISRIEGLERAVVWERTQPRNDDATLNSQYALENAVLGQLAVT